MGATPFIYDILREIEENGGELPDLKFYLCGGAPVPGYMVQKHGNLEYSYVKYMVLQKVSLMFLSDHQKQLN